MILSIRSMLPSDLEGKAYVHWKSWQETYPGLVTPAYLDGLTLEKCIENTKHRPGSIVVAEADGYICGFAAYGPCRDADLPDCGEVYALYVLQAYQHLKIGYALMNACVARLQEFSSVVVWVLQGNEPAIRFYERYGFHFDSTTAELLLGKPCVELRMVYEKPGTKKQTERSTIQ